MKRTKHRFVWKIGPFFRQDIYCTGTADLYLRRWGLKLPFSRRVYLHRFERPDIEIYHDHPWDFSSLILRGNYVEMSCGHNPLSRERAHSLGELGVEVRKVFTAGQWSHHRAEDLHFIKSLHPPNNRGSVWTLVFTGLRRRTWGFITPTGWRSWREYLGVIP